MHSRSLEHAETPALASILVIDDEEAVRGLFRAILEPVGYTVVEASNARDGIRRFHETPTDVVITDICASQADGSEIIRALRANRPSVKILAVSGSRGTEERLGEAQRLGADAMLNKPLGVRELRAAVACLLAGPPEMLWHQVSDEGPCDSPDPLCLALSISHDDARVSADSQQV